MSIIVTILVGSLFGMVLVYQKGFPQIKKLEDLTPKVMTTIYDDRSNLIKEFAIEKRTLLKSTEIPQILKTALLVSEDRNYYSHWGISFKGLTRAVLGVIQKKNMGGGSTITMQLARNLFLFDERSQRTISRKLKEILLAIQIEKKYSKEQILTYYCNLIPFGGSAYGVEAASKHYFGKPVKDIAVAEAALLATVIPSPNRIYNVFKRPENCQKKRDYILKSMQRLGFISEEELKNALLTELPKKPSQFYKDSIGDHFLEETRKYIEAKYGDNLLYQGGLKVYTTLNSEMQRWAENALKEGLRQLDKRRGWRRGQERFNLVKNNLDLKTLQLPSWKRTKIEEGKIIKGVTLKVTSKKASIRMGDYTGTLNGKDRTSNWTKMNLRNVLKKGDVALFKILDIDEEKKELILLLEQEPEVQGAIIVIDNKTGEIKAMVGGYSFEKSRWNNATQAKRQPGSSFKPIIYTAAIENGYTASTIIEDEYFAKFDEHTEELWEPHNYPKGFLGPLTLRRALQKSRNVVSARIVDDLTPQKIAESGKKFGISSFLNPVISIALGSSDVTLEEMTAAYTVFPNMGIRVNPYFIKHIKDQNNIVEENYPQKKRVLEPETAYIMNYLMQGVVKYGTGYRARPLKAPIGGKTGTTNEYTNAWFIGFSPSLTVGVWVGHEATIKSIGDKETGSSAASPIFVSFMEKYLEMYPEMQQFRKPAGVIMVKIDKHTGKLYTPDCLYPFMEAFLPGTEPSEYCSEEEHRKFLDYYGGKVTVNNEEINE